MTSKVKSDVPTAAQFVAAALAQIVKPLSDRMIEVGSYLTLTGDFTANAWRISTPTADLLVQPVRLNRLNIVDANGNPDVNAVFLDGRLGSILVPFSTLATRNATISLYELDWLLSQYVTRTESAAVTRSLAAVEQAGD